ncbi:MAG: hypothetical protein RL660_2310 [Bacteroidota bacterium]|jgi:hypothetical protein
MKNLTVAANQIAISYKNGAVHNVYTAGKHLIGFFETAIKYDIANEYHCPINIDIALQNTSLQAVVDVIEVADNELKVMYYNGKFHKILTSGVYMFFKHLQTLQCVAIDLNNYVLDGIVDANLIANPNFAAYVRQFSIEAYEQGVLYIDGKFDAIVAPGTYRFLKNATSIHIVKADMRTLALDLNGQEILTKDKAQIRINFTVQYKIVDIVKYAAQNKDADKQLHTAAQLALRTAIGRLSIDELMDDKALINQQIMADTLASAATLGIEVLSCGIKDVILPADIKNILNQVLIAEKRAQANIITRREETASTRSLLNTAKLMEDNAMLWKLKEMEYVEKIAEKINTISLSGNGQVIDQLKTIFVK